MEEIKNVSIESLKPSPYQGRLVRGPNKKGKIDDPAMKSLMESIEKKGLMTPIIVRTKDEKYEIVDGHRRVESYRRLKKDEIEVIVKNYNDKDAQVFSVVGNLMRQNLNLIEKALAFKKILSTGAFRGQKDFSQAIGKHETYVSDILNTLELDKRIIDDLATNRTTEDVRLLRAIRRVDKAVNNTSLKQWKLYQRFKAEGLTRKQVMDAVKETKESSGPFKIEGTSKSFVIHFSQKLSNEKKQKMIELLNEKIDEWLKEESTE